jgi:hypothetical protein
MVKKKEYCLTKLNNCDRKILEKYSKFLIDNNSGDSYPFEKSKEIK